MVLLVKQEPLASRCLALAFLIIALPLLLLLADLTPLGQVPDEGAHALRAEALLHRHLVGHRAVVTAADGRKYLAAGIDADWGVLFAMAPPAPMRVTVQEDAARAAFRWIGRDDFAEITPLAVYAPFFYVPAAIGMEIGKRIGLLPAADDFAGRLANLAGFLLLGGAALLLARRGRMLLFCVLTFPMTLCLAASLSQDGLIIAASALAAALLSRGGGRATWPLRDPSYLSATILLAMIITTKPPYAPLAAMLLLPLGRRPELARTAASRWPGWVGKLAAVGLVAAPSLAWTWYTQTYVAALTQHPLAAAGPLWPGGAGDMFSSSDPALQLRVLLADPWLIARLPVATLIHDHWLLPQMVGVLGWMTVVLPTWLYAIWGAALICACAADLLAPTGEGLPVSGRSFALLVLAGAGCVMAVLLSQYLVWTPIGLDRIEGPQGRYLTPIMPLLALALPRLGYRPRLLGVCATVPVLAAALGIVVLPHLIVDSFYLR